VVLIVGDISFVVATGKGVHGSLLAAWIVAAYNGGIKSRLVCVAVAELAGEAIDRGEDGVGLVAFNCVKKSSLSMSLNLSLKEAVDVLFGSFVVVTGLLHGSFI
jgi:hypothetical protein